MAKHGYRFLDSDMHVFEPHDLYLRYMDPRWGDQVPRAEPRRAYGFHRFAMADGAPVRKSRIPDAQWGDERRSAAVQMPRLSTCKTVAVICPRVSSGRSQSAPAPFPLPVQSMPRRSSR